MAATTAFREALNQGISSGNLVDTKIILYSHRDSSGRVCRPRALYASSLVLRTVPYFNDLLFGNFTESQLKDFNEDTVDAEESTEDYGYLSDSDLEDDEDEKDASFRPAVGSKVISAKRTGRFRVISFKRTKRSKVASSKHADGSKVDVFDPFGVPNGDRKTLCEEREEHVEKGKVVKIPDMAFVTFQAFLMYLYTNTIEFAPFGSDKDRRSRSAEIVTPSDDKVPRPSPKSIYRLADKYDVPALKAFVLNHIRNELGNCDIVEESFSRFASRYDEIKSLYINQLASVWMEDSTTEATQASVEKKIDSFVEGDLEHATGMLSALWEVVNNDKNIGAPSNTSSVITSPAHWTSMKTALIKSIRKGVFFDREYWARHSKAGGVFKPVYFSSIIMGDKKQQLNDLVKYFKGQNSPINELEGDINADSDCEGGLTGADEVTLKWEEQEEESRAVLTAGSFSAWKSLFFYRCTDTISFAPLQSQGPHSRSSYIRGKTVATAPPPCSPKNIYVLAKLVKELPIEYLRHELTCRIKLGIQRLCDIALADIKSKVSSDNVVDEVFSRVTACQKEIMEMECELLISNFKDPRTIALVKENIGHISDGSSSHCAAVLKLGLKKAFELKKQKGQTLPGVLLRCTNNSCEWWKTPAYCSAIGSRVYCPICTCYMVCAGCGYTRSDVSELCQSCGKRFV